MPPTPSAKPTSPAPATPGNRPLSDSELVEARKVFGEGIDYAPVRVCRQWGLFAAVMGGRAIVLGNDVNMPPGTFEELDVGKHRSLLIHELTHVWQFQRQGWGYAPGAVWAQIFGGGYAYDKELHAGKAWRQMNLEQQAQLLQDACRGSYFEIQGARFGLVDTKVIVLRPEHDAPHGFTDYTPVLTAALEELRSPRRA